MPKQLAPAQVHELETGVRQLRDALANIAESAPHVGPEKLASVAALGAFYADTLLDVFK